MDMKLEVMVIPVADVDRAKAFYTKLACGPTPISHSITVFGCPIHAARLGVLGQVRHENHHGRAGLCPRFLPDRFRC